MAVQIPQIGHAGVEPFRFGLAHGVEHRVGDVVLRNHVVIVPDLLIAHAGAGAADIAAQGHRVELKFGDGAKTNGVVMHLQLAVDPQFDLAVRLTRCVQLHHHLEIGPLPAGDVARFADILPELFAVAGRLG